MKLNFVSFQTRAITFALLNADPFALQSITAPTTMLTGGTNVSNGSGPNRARVAAIGRKRPFDYIVTVHDTEVSRSQPPTLVAPTLSYTADIMLRAAHGGLPPSFFLIAADVTNLPLKVT